MVVAGCGPCATETSKTAVAIEQRRKSESENAMDNRPKKCVCVQHAHTRTDVPCMHEPIDKLIETPTIQPLLGILLLPSNMGSIVRHYKPLCN